MATSPDGSDKRCIALGVSDIQYAQSLKKITKGENYNGSIKKTVPGDPRDRLPRET